MNQDKQNLFKMFQDRTGGKSQIVMPAFKPQEHNLNVGYQPARVTRYKWRE